MNDTGRRAPVPLWQRVSLTAMGVAVAAVATTFVVKTGDPASVSSTESPKRTVVATSGPRTSTPPPAPVTVTVDGLPPETPVLVPPTTPAAAALAAPMVDPRQVVYTVSGNQRPDDPVTVTYADETGALRTVENVALPWQLTVVPVMPVNYVTASSGGSQLNCWITDATGATVAAQTDNAISATCNR
ncbi:MmpS family transport accessory protein [Mycobacterium sp. M26]|uniref:MmpS family transport accessory protein n=1 Tax=Mycobacterium sp. M26 TaxID=1762962 RepID=UPI00073EF4E8|nr:MmpS family transport accessory protein [Mycobacterium sp. M26]